MTVKEVTRQYRLEQWREIIQDRIKSVLKVDEYCRQNNISRHAYFYWLHLIRIEELNKTVNPVPAIGQVTNEVAFCELTPPASIPANCAEVNDHNDDYGTNDISLVINGITIKVSEGTPSSLLRKVLEVAKDVK